MRSVALVGTSPNTRLLANAEVGDVEIWSCSGAWEFLDRKDRHFELHSPDAIQGFSGDKWLPYLHFLQRCEVPVYMQEVDARFPSSVRYPIEDIAPKYRRYLTSTMAFMVALAIEEGVDQIKVYGVDMQADEEWGVQRPNFEWLLGIAEGKGIDVVMPTASALLKGPLYIYDTEDQARLEMRNLLNKRVRFLQNRQDFFHAQIAAFRAQEFECYRQMAILHGIKDEHTLNAIAEGKATLPWAKPRSIPEIPVSDNGVPV